MSDLQQWIASHAKWQKSQFEETEKGVDQTDTAEMLEVTEQGSGTAMINVLRERRQHKRTDW